MIRFSVNTHRGCFGGCAFCTISMHQGKYVVSRSEESILKEVKTISRDSDFKGYLSDLGGPSANMYAMKGLDADKCAKCRRPSCIFPSVCRNLDADHRPLLSLYRKVDALPSIKKSFIGSGVRYDLLLTPWLLLVLRLIHLLLSTAMFLHCLFILIIISPTLTDR